MFTIDIVGLLAILGIFQGLIFSAIFWLRNENVSNRVFSLFLLASSIRIAKNIIVYLKGINTEPLLSDDLYWILIFIGITHQFAIGPLLYFYVVSKLDTQFTWHKRYLWHFLPFFSLLVISFFVKWVFWQNGGLWMSYSSILVYYLLSFRYFTLHKNEVHKEAQNWLTVLLIIIAAIIIGYSPILFHYLGYIGGGVLYMVSILLAGYIIISSKNRSPIFHNKYQSSSLTSRTILAIKEKLLHSIEKEHVYLNPELTLNILAEKLSTKPHHLSRIINQEFNKSFSEYINSFRIQEAAVRLKSTKHDHLKISALAYDCGFNSVPTFNTLFKKTYNVTPSKYRELHKSSS